MVGRQTPYTDKSLERSLINLSENVNESVDMMLQENSRSQLFKNLRSPVASNIVTPATVRR
jgi:hypothetical protein